MPSHGTVKVFQGMSSCSDLRSMGTSKIIEAAVHFQTHLWNSIFKFKYSYEIQIQFNDSLTTPL